MAIEQVKLTREQLRSEISEMCNTVSNDKLQSIAREVFGVTLNPCGSKDGTVFITNLDMVRHTPLASYRLGETDLQILPLIKRHKEQCSIAQARAKVRLELLSQGIHFSQSEFDVAFNSM